MSSIFSGSNARLRFWQGAAATRGGVGVGSATVGLADADGEAAIAAGEFDRRAGATRRQGQAGREACKHTTSHVGTSLGSPRSGHHERRCQASAFVLERDPRSQDGGAEGLMPRSVTRDTHTGPMDIRPLDREIWPALAELFAAGGDPKWCWCQWWRKRNANWTNTTAADNRADLERLATADPAPGLVALRDGRAIGWVGLGPREEFERLAHSRTIPQLPGEAVWSINCFVVARDARRSGVARALLRAAVSYARDHGASLVEGYPVRTAGGKVTSAGLYTGSEGMFDGEGFAVEAETTSGARRARRGLSCAASHEGRCGIARSALSRQTHGHESPGGWPPAARPGSRPRRPSRRSFERGRTNNAASTLVYHASIAAW